jgi:hypothetical protein
MTALEQNLATGLVSLPAPKMKRVYNKRHDQVLYRKRYQTAIKWARRNGIPFRWNPERMVNEAEVRPMTGGMKTLWLSTVY